MSAQLRFTENDIHCLPIKTGDEVYYKGEKVTITSIYLREFSELVNDIIVTFLSLIHI